MFFYHHDHREQEDENSFYNLHEVFMALLLALYLVREEDVSPHCITILTTYNAQLNQLENERAQGDWSWLEEVRIIRGRQLSGRRKRRHYSFAGAEQYSQRCRFPPHQQPNLRGSVTRTQRPLHSGQHDHVGQG